MCSASDWRAAADSEAAATSLLPRVRRLPNRLPGRRLPEGLSARRERAFAGPAPPFISVGLKGMAFVPWRLELLFVAMQPEGCWTPTRSQKQRNAMIGEYGEWAGFDCRIRF